MLESPYVLELQAEAKREATLKAKREDLTLVLQGRFGALPEDVLRRIAELDPSKVNQLLLAAGQAAKLEDLPL